MPLLPLIETAVLNGTSGALETKCTEIRRTTPMTCCMNQTPVRYSSVAKS